MAERTPERIQKAPETHQWWIISEVVRTGDILPGKVLEDPKMREKLHNLLASVWRTEWAIRFSHDTGVIYVSFPDYGETVILRGTQMWIIGPDYTGKWANINFTENARLKLQNYLERKKIRNATQTSLADLSSDYEATA